MESEAQNQFKMLNIIRARITQQINQRNMMGIHTPAHVKTDIIEGQSEIAKIKQWLHNQGYQVTSNPIDTATSTDAIMLRLSPKLLVEFQNAMPHIDFSQLIIN